MNVATVDDNAPIAQTLLDLQRVRPSSQSQQPPRKRLKPTKRARFAKQLVTVMDCPPYQASQSDAETLVLYRDDIWYMVRASLLRLLQMRVCVCVFSFVNL